MPAAVKALELNQDGNDLRVKGNKLQISMGKGTTDTGGPTTVKNVMHFDV